MCERRQNGGRKGKEDRNSEDEEEAGDSQENTMNTGVTNTENQTFISITTSPLYFLHLLFYRVGEEERGTKGCAALAGAVTIIHSPVTSCSGGAVVRAGSVNLHS